MFSGADPHWDLYLPALQETLYMVGLSIFIGTLIGIPLGVLLVITRPGHIFEQPIIFQIINTIINIIRSVPFIILLFALIPLTKLIVGTFIGVEGAIVPLVVYVSPYIARLMESALLEVDAGLIEAFQAMGATRRQIIFNVMLKEARPAIVLSLTIAIIGLIDATAMAGIIGAGGLGNLAYRYGFQRWETLVMIITVIILIVLVQLLQTLGNRIARTMRKE
ncbi:MULTISPECIES: methionine ABC transporter permease [Aneurinibacillus]|uniref:ABC transporter permease n=1 Tax=Aneurinibacillus thermoaerophilus TaxID=143495 RepID=A0A1G8AU05_ANETH|nr:MULTISPECIES: methionine ABC transporter permease [Aneurinibacillus]AMA72839.1 metal ABC transporter permease [Aneurinibacillus sp. XH2]MED0675225.1 ABC transporter permease [Aneurinibacillus thermoaerophilus]MED0680079.1 ABC transporter permease [Aneurinibacillus thermoaerophilus]MED0738163.1 ABC transporter permease [Aneurinibacillus thermoaerophilus]MED0758219.1 ABC transporter permease [Aneurinibacillus thermoaerophilus]